MYDIRILRSLLFSWSDSPQGRTHHTPNGGNTWATHEGSRWGLSSQYRNFYSNLLCSAYYLRLQCNWDLWYSNCLIFFGEETSIFCWLGEGQSPGCLLPRGSGGGLVASPTLHPTFAWLHAAHLRVTHPLKNTPTAILFQDDSDVPWHALEMHIWDLVSYGSSSSNIYRGPTFTTNANSSADLQEIGLSFGKFKV